MPTIQDKEFGEVTVRRSALSRSVKLSIAPNGTLRVSMPVHAPLFLAKRLIASSRDSIRTLYGATKHEDYYDGMQIGKSHSLSIVDANISSVSRHGQRIVVSLSDGTTVDDIRTKIHDEILSALRREAKSYLPRRLSYLADKHGFSYTKVRFSHSSTRWGSCSSNGTISLNIALMKLPFPLIDYVIIHELSHTKHMNHSKDFWHLVGSLDPSYIASRAALKNESPAM